MNNQDKNQEEKPYIKEKIVKKKAPVKKFVIRLVLCVVFAIVFGAVAAVTFQFVKPLADREEPKESSQSRIDFPEFTQPITSSETETESETVQLQTSSEAATTEPDAETESVFNHNQESWIRGEVSSQVSAQVSAHASSQSLSIDDVKREDDIYAAVVKTATDSIVTIRGYVGDSLAWQTQAMMIYRRDDSGEILLLADLNNITAADRMTAVFSVASDREFEVVLKASDSIYMLAMLSVSTDHFTNKELESIKVIAFGNNFMTVVPNTIILVGAPYGTASSTVGHITYVEAEHYELDSAFRMFGTDISIPEGASGFAINLSGEFIGVLNRTEDSQGGFATLVGTEKIRDTLSCMSSGNNASLLGVYGQTVTTELQERGIPAGVYVNAVRANSPAYNAGISAGDIITSISQATITEVSRLAKALTSNHLPGESVKVTLYRESRGEYKSITVNVTLGSR